MKPTRVTLARRVPCFGYMDRCDSSERRALYFEVCMRFFSKTKDGGPQSPVDAFFIFEIKAFASIAILRFNKGSREAFHTHAFNALTWFLSGNLVEEQFSGEQRVYRRQLLPKFTSRSCNHRVIANATSWCFTIRGPWKSSWTEDTQEAKTTLTHGRKVVNIEYK